MKYYFLFVLLSCFSIKAQTTCNTLGRIILIDENKTDAIWRSQHAKYMCVESNLNPCSEETCCEKIITIDLERIALDIPISEWLYKNQDLICFENSYYYIEKSHFIEPTSSNYTELVISLNRAIVDKHFFGYTYNELKNLIPDFDSFKYNQYLVIQQKIDKEMDITLNQYTNLDSNFSIPFIRSVAKKIGLTSNDFKNCFLKFVYLTENEKTETYLVVTYKGKEYLYDYSNNPLVSS